MAQIPLSIDSYLDNGSSMTIEEVNYTRALTFENRLDHSSFSIEEVNFTKALYINESLDNSTIQLLPSKYVYIGAENYLDHSELNIAFNKTQSLPIEGYIDNSFTSLRTNVLSPLSIDAYLDKSLTNMSVNYTHLLSIEAALDKSNFEVIELTRYFLDEPPVGEIYVAVQGTDVPLFNYNISKSGTYAINTKVHWNRLSTNGTTIKFLVKNRLSDSEHDAYINFSTKGSGIVVKSIKDIGTTGTKEYIAQIVLRPEDLYLLPALRTTKYYYQVLLLDSLNESYIINEGYFNLNPQ